MNDAGVFADPANARIFGIDALHHRTSINIAAGLWMESMRARKLFDCGFYLLETLEQGIVIILAAPGIAGDPASRWIVGIG